MFYVEEREMIGDKEVDSLNGVWLGIKVYQPNVDPIRFAHTLWYDLVCYSLDKSLILFVSHVTGRFVVYSNSATMFINQPLDFEYRKPDYVTFSYSEDWSVKHTLPHGRGTDNSKCYRVIQHTKSGPISGVLIGALYVSETRKCYISQGMNMSCAIVPDIETGLNWYFNNPHRWVFNETEI